MAKLKKGYIKCPHCNQQFSNIRYLLSHIEKRHPKSEHLEG